MITIDQCLFSLIKSGQVSIDEAISKTSNPNAIYLLMEEGNI